jgi:2-oxoglutarate dehydrogenase E2 component (dihydrolipoamide succinyltransferase)
MGEGITEAVLVKWLKNHGESINEGDPMVEVSTDKVDTEIPSPASGKLSHIAQEGATVKVNHVIATIAADGAAAEAPKAAATATATVPPPPGAPQHAPMGSVTAPPKPNGAPSISDDVQTNLRSSPVVRKMAKEKGLNLGDIAGTGLGGRITKRDLEAFLASDQSSTPQVAAGHAPMHAPARLNVTTQNGIELLDGVPVRRQKMTHVRKLIADHMVESVRVSPHVTTVFEIDLDNVVKIREEYKREFQDREGFSLTYTPFLIHAAVLAIKEHPIVNTSLDGNEILFKDQINIGCAVAIKDGLIVPVIKNAGELNLLGIARRLNDLATRARTKKLNPDDVKGGTFSITNPGGFGSLTSNPIINQPQVAILGIGSIVKRPVVINDMIAVRPMILISLTFDHRVIDGEGGAKYLATLKQILENYQHKPI